MNAILEENPMVRGAQAAWDALCEAEEPQTDPGDRLWEEIGTYHGFRFGLELERFARETLTVQERAEYRAGLWAWMKDNARWAFVDWLLEHAGCGPGWGAA